MWKISEVPDQTRYESGTNVVRVTWDYYDLDSKRNVEVGLEFDKTTGKLTGFKKGGEWELASNRNPIDEQNIIHCTGATCGMLENDMSAVIQDIRMKGLPNKSVPSLVKPEMITPQPEWKPPTPSEIKPLTEEDIKWMTPAQVKEYYDNLFKGEKLAGAIVPEEIKQEAIKAGLTPDEVMELERQASREIRFPIAPTTPIIEPPKPRVGGLSGNITRRLAEIDK